MCCITHNKLVLGVTFISIALGIFILITSSYVIHYEEDLESQTTHFRHLLACACFTLGTGTVQTISSLFFLSRRISTQRWISINAVVFLVVILGICIAMSHFSMLPPPAPTHSNLNLSYNEFENSSSTVAFLNSTIMNQNRTEENNTLIESNEGSMEDSFEDVNSNPDSGISVGMEPGPGDPKSDSSEEESVDVDVDLDTENSHSSGVNVIVLLRFYFTSLLSNCLALPIFLGLVASKASKYEVRGKNLLDTD